MQANNGNHKTRWWNAIWRSRGSSETAAYGRLAMQLHYDLPREAGARSVLLATPRASRLASHGALELAASLGREVNRLVLLIDVCPKNPEVSEILGCAQSRGWADLLQDSSLDLEATVLATSSEHVQFLPAGTSRHIADPSQIEARLKSVHERYDFAVFFGGAVLDEFSGLGLPSRVGCTLLLLVDNETRSDDLEAAETALTACNPRALRRLVASAGRGKPGLQPGSRASEEARLSAVPSWVSEKSS